MRPAIINEAILIIKASSLISVVGILELTRSAQALASSTFEPLPAYALCGAIYLVINVSLSMLARGRAA
jgi:polar amino acid transport system permease protein